MLPRLRRGRLHIESDFPGARVCVCVRVCLVGTFLHTNTFDPNIIHVQLTTN